MFTGVPVRVSSEPALAAKASESGFIQQMEYTDVALTRFFGVPADMVDVQSSTGSVTYANITQRNLQLLVMNLGGAVKRREDTHKMAEANRAFAHYRW